MLILKRAFRFFLFALVFLSLFFLMPVMALANEGGGHEAPAEEHGSGHEAPAEGHGGGSEGGHEAGGHEGAKVEKKDLPAWVEIQNKVSSLESKINSIQGNIRKLIEDKKHLPANSPAVKAVLEDMVKQHNELRALAAEYEKQNAILKFRFPEKGAKGVRNYEKIEVKSLEDMETELGTEGRLNRNLKVMRSKYPSKSAVVTSTTLMPIQKEPQQKSIEEAGAVILRK